MTQLRITITELLWDGCPPFVACVFEDAAGVGHELHEKFAILSDADTLPPLPAPASIMCSVLGVRVGADGRRVVRVDLRCPWSCETVAGVTIVEVFEDQLFASDWVWVAVDGVFVSDWVWVAVDGVLVRRPTRVGTNDGLNYGRCDGLETVEYQAVFPLAALDWYAPAFAELVAELREDDRLYGADDPSEFAAMGYPVTLAGAAEHPELLAEAISTYADRELLAHHFPFVEATAEFVINSTDAVWVLADQIVICGRCWVRSPV